MNTTTATTENYKPSVKTRRRVRSAPTKKPVVALPPDFREKVQRIVDDTTEKVMQLFENGVLPTEPAEFKKLEERLLLLVAQQVVSAIVGLVLAALHAREDFVLWCMGATRARHRMRAGQDRTVTVSVAGGDKINLKTPYMMPIQDKEKKKKRGKPRQRGERGKTGSCLYPVLAQLGFACRVSPYVASTTARAAAQLDSYEEAVDALARQGLHLDVNTVRRITYRFADAGLMARETGHRKDTSLLAGKRVVVCFDGGRLRYRLQKKGRRRANGYHGYDAPWREPKIMTIYTVDSRGRKTKASPVYEGTLAPWRDAFEFFISVLARYGARDAEVILIAADGSNSIWDRKDELVSRLEIDASRVRECVDFYHAVERLDDAARAADSMTDEQRRQWIRRQARRLKKGKVERVISAIESLLADDPDNMEKHANYFRKRTHRMRYDELRSEGLPLGSGSVESAIRRIVNLRLKGTGVFWKPENAERLLHLRCWLKSGRWYELESAFHESTLSPSLHIRPQVLDRVTA